MFTFLIAVGSFLGFIIAYNTYGRWIARKVFALDSSAEVPSKQLNDGVDYCPSKKSIVFGHHFTSIAGTGPIVGPAIAVFWGWLPALLWVVFGSIFIGAVHDFGALVVSMRNRGQTVGEVAGRLISPRTKLLFLLALFFALTVVLAIFGLVIAGIFALYPESVLAVWVSLPIAIVVGYMVRKGGANLLPLSVVSLLLIYAAVYVGAYYLPINLKDFGIENPVVWWTLILLAYCAVASVLPVWMLLQPRDYVNSHQLFVALALLMAGLCVATLTGQADLFSSTPAMVDTSSLPAGTPPIWPFLFITIACGAISGFHCLVSSGTSSKQLSQETDAQAIGYGSMLLEGALAVVVILACCAGVGMGRFDRTTVELDDGAKQTQYVQRMEMSDAGDSQPIVGMAAWRTRYDTSVRWDKFGLDAKVGAFIDGGANFLAAIGIPLKLGIGLIAVLVACFAATTLDSATRLQRYVVQEIGSGLKLPPLRNMYVATIVAVVLGGWIALLPNEEGVRGKGGLLLWPLFGATNQLLAGLAFMVTTFYLWRRNKPVWFVLIPMVIMIIMPAWALCWQLFNSETGWMHNLAEKKLLAIVGLTTLGLQIWMVVEAIVMWPKAKGVREPELPPLPKASKA
jgi:carbon starvation protein